MNANTWISITVSIEIHCDYCVCVCVNDTVNDGREQVCESGHRTQNDVCFARKLFIEKLAIVFSMLIIRSICLFTLCSVYISWKHLQMPQKHTHTSIDITIAFEIGIVFSLFESIHCIKYVRTLRGAIISSIEPCQVKRYRDLWCWFWNALQVSKFRHNSTSTNYP